MIGDNYDIIFRCEIGKLMFLWRWLPRFLLTVKRPGCRAVVGIDWLKWYMRVYGPLQPPRPPRHMREGLEP